MSTSVREGEAKSNAVSPDPPNEDKCLPTCSGIVSHADTSAAVLDFRFKSNSLRLSASKVAALSGFHPYAALPRFMLDLVYQGPAGRALLVHDAELLGLEMRSDREVLANLANRAGPEAAAAVREAEEIRSGQKVVGTAAAAAKVKLRGSGEARRAAEAGNISGAEARALEEGLRGLVDTGFGLAHESGALDLYERRYGCEVRERNAEVRFWPFEKAVCWDSVDGTGKGEGVDGAPSVTPMADAAPLSRGNQPATEEGTTRNISKEKVGSGYNGISCDREPSDHSNEDEQIVKSAISRKRSRSFEIPHTTPHLKLEPRPFFSILGSIDGMRDELCAGAVEDFAPDEFGDTLSLRPVVIECKHRMRRAMIPPPFYDQIQAVVYCLMYGTERAEIVQVTRILKRERDKRSNKEKKNVEGKEGSPSRDVKGSGISNVLSRTRSIKPESRKGNESAESDIHVPDRACKVLNTDKMNDNKGIPIHFEGRPNGVDIKPAITETEVHLTVSSLNLDDPSMQHRNNFEAVVLPRLRSFVDAVYAIRSCDDRRYQLLQSCAEAVSDVENLLGWAQVLELCPWLKHCDIALHRLSK